MCGISIILGTKEPVITSIARRARRRNDSSFAHTTGTEAMTRDLLGDIALRGREAHTNMYGGRHLFDGYQRSANEVHRLGPRAVNHAPP